MTEVLELSPDLKINLIREAKQGIEDSLDTPLAETKDMGVLPIRDTRAKIVDYLARTYFGTPLKGASTRVIERQLKAVVEEAAQELGIQRRRVSLRLNDVGQQVYKVGRIMQPTLGRDNEYYLAPLH